MNISDIAIFSVSRIISERISTILIEKGIDIPIYELEHYDAAEKAKEIVKLGTKIIISRGGTADVLRRNVDVPIIEIPHDFYGVHRSLEEAKKFGDKIAAVGFPQYCNMLRHYQKITNDDFKICQVYNHKDIENITKQLKEDNFNVLIGGLTVSHYAALNGLHVIMGDTDNLSIEMAINQAINILKHIKKEKLKYDIVDSGLNASSDGIIIFDSQGVISHCNLQANVLFECVKRDNIFRLGIFKSIHESIINENNIKSLIIDYQNCFYDISLRHIHSKGDFFSIFTAKIINTLSNAKLIKSANRFPTRYSFSDILGTSQKIKECIDYARIYSQNDLPVYIEGETGTGKELFAQSIHKESTRNSKPFIALNCSAIPESLLESELFGYEEGVFTGAKKGGKAGVFELVDGGTIFLDEVSEISELVQLKLLRVLQERAFSRIGGTSLISTSFRLITASNKDLKKLIAENCFRMDFFYRINILKLEVPNLHERGNDILILADKIIETNKRNMQFSDDALEFILKYRWPGNIRELQSLIYRLVVLCESNVITIQDLLTHGEYFDSINMLEKQNQPILEINEKEIIIQTLIDTKGDKVKTAILLGISPTTLWRRIKKYQIHL